MTEFPTERDLIKKKNPKSGHMFALKGVKPLSTIEITEIIVKSN